MCKYLSETGLLGLLEGEDALALQQAAEGEALALPHAPHLPLGTQSGVGLRQLHTETHR